MAILSEMSYSCMLIALLYKLQVYHVQVRHIFKVHPSIRYKVRMGTSQVVQVGYRLQCTKLIQ
jgi:hypothetical protein